MADKVQRPKSHVLQGLDWGKSFYYTHEADAFIESLETELRDTRKTVHGWIKENGPGGWIDDLRVELRDTRRALERLRTNARYIFDNKAVRDWAETLAEVDEVLGRERTEEIKGRLEE